MPTRIDDQWDGAPLRKLYLMNTQVKPGERVLNIRNHRRGPGRMWPDWTHDCWTGRYHGYGRDQNGVPLFRSMVNAVRFAEAAWHAGFRVKGGKR